MSDICSEYRYIYALRRSRVRLGVLRFLVRVYPNSVPASEISRKTGFYLSDVLGALLGGVRYSVDNSLVNLGMAEFLVVGNHRLYRATRLGISCLRRVCLGEICGSD
ncbi:MAG: archaellum operon transcriptional activator EarA family protein [Fervidicoccaceae archaeon]